MLKTLVPLNTVVETGIIFCSVLFDEYNIQKNSIYLKIIFV